MTYTYICMYTHIIWCAYTYRYTSYVFRAWDLGFPGFLLTPVRIPVLRAGAFQAGKGFGIRM